MSNSSSPAAKSNRREKSSRSEVLDELMQQKICAVLALGCSRKTAADYLGCLPKLIQKTARRRPEFAGLLAKSEAVCEISALTQLGKAVKDERNWRVGTWLLERRFPDRYGPRKPRSASPRQVAEVMNQLIDIVSASVTDAADRRRIVERVQSLMERLREFDEAAEGS